MQEEVEKAIKLTIDYEDEYWGVRKFVCEETPGGIMLEKVNTSGIPIYDGGLVLLVNHDGVVSEFQEYRKPFRDNRKYICSVEIDFDKKSFRLLDV